MWQLFLLALLGLAAADDCNSCVTSGKKWCGDPGKTVTCGHDIFGCTNVIKDTLNCPRYPDPKYAYDDGFARNYVFPFIGAVYSNNSLTCLKNTVPTVTFYKNVVTACGTGNETCTVTTAYDNTRQLIIISFAGTEGDRQLADEIDSFFHDKQSFFGVGNVFSYFYKAFYYLWDGGLESAVRSLLYLYPNYKLVATGHSMGAAISCVFASHVVKVNLWQPQNIQFLTFGQPRTGDKNFSMWHDNTFPYSYRVNHHRDIAPHIPPRGGADEVFHHRYEVWYNNNMTVGSNYTLCAEADGLYCSNKQVDLSTDDHYNYFDIDLYAYAATWCAKTKY